MVHVEMPPTPYAEVFSSGEMEAARNELRDFYQRSERASAPIKYSKSMDPALRAAFLPGLRQVFNGKCAYCEQLISPELGNESYDHFRPKNSARGFDKDFSLEHYWWLTYDHRNIYYSCVACNQFKSAWFPVEGERCAPEEDYQLMLLAEKNLLIDPCHDIPEEHLIYLEDGTVTFTTPKGKATVELLKLNRGELVEGRKAAVARVKEEMLNLSQALSSREIPLHQMSDLYRNLDRKLASGNTEEYSAVQRQFLTNWLKDNQLYDRVTGPQPDTRLLEDLAISKPLKLKKFNLTKDTKAARSQADQDLDLKKERHIYVEKIELNNFKGFDHLAMDLRKKQSVSAPADSSKNPQKEPWTLFLGENGVGKSSILKALVLGLSGSDYFKQLDLADEKLLSHGKTRGSIKIWLVGEKEPIVVRFGKKSLSSTITRPKLNLVAYNSMRLLPKKGKLEPEGGTFQGVRAANLFAPWISLVDADQWLRKLDDQTFSFVAIGLRSLMLMDDEDRIERIGSEIKFFRGKDDPLSIGDMSDGYRSLYVVAVDIMATLAGEKVTYDVAEGMVLIDELGTHLHPRWRMQVINRLRKTFPKLQFIVTTHEPLCLKGLEAGETVVLTKDEHQNVVAITDLPNPGSMRVDQILNSEFFGLHSATDPETEQFFTEYYDLLGRGSRTPEEENTMAQLRAQLPYKKHLGDSLRDELVYYVVDELLAKSARKGGNALRAQLKEAAVKRVQELWKQID